MPYQESVTSRITRNTTSVESSTFDTPLFCAPHFYFPETERTRTYGSITEVQEDTDIPVESDAYAALSLAFSQNPAPDQVVLGRQEADSVILTPYPLADGVDYSITLVVTDDTLGTSVTSTKTVESGIGDTAAEIATALFTELTTITNLTITDDTLGNITVNPDSGYSVQITNLERLADNYTSTETAVDLLANIQLENDDWYFMTWSDHTEAGQLAMAAAIESTGSTNKPKMYFTSTVDVDTLKAVVDPSDDVIGKLKDLGYTRTVIEWHDQADTIFPEVGAVAYNSIYEAGTTTWKFMQVVGVPIAADPVTGKNLTTAKQGFIEDRNGNWTAEERGVKFFREGVTVSGEYIDIIRGIDYHNDKIEVALLNLLLNQKGGKIAITDNDLAKVTNVVDKINSDAVDIGFLSGYIPASLPLAKDIPFVDKVARLLENLKWTGYLAGAVHTILVDGNATYET